MADCVLRAEYPWPNQVDVTKSVWFLNQPFWFPNHDVVSESVGLISESAVVVSDSAVLVSESWLVSDSAVLVTDFSGDQHWTRTAQPCWFLLNFFFRNGRTCVPLMALRDVLHGYVRDHGCRQRAGSPRTFLSFWEGRVHQPSSPATTAAAAGVANITHSAASLAALGIFGRRRAVVWRAGVLLGATFAQAG